MSSCPGRKLDDEIHIYLKITRINLQHAKTWGYLVNGTWNGILADMQAGFVDISVCPFQFKEERMDVCEFTVVTYVVR